MITVKRNVNGDLKVNNAHVTLTDIADMMTKNTNFKVVSDVTGLDVTFPIILQIFSDKLNEVNEQTRKVL